MKISGRGYNIDLPFDKEAIRFQALTKHLKDLKPTVLKAMRDFLTGEAVKDFRERSDRKEAGGVRWEPIGMAGARSRYAARSGYAGQTKQLQSIKTQADPLRQSLRKKLPKGASKKAARAKIARDFMETKDGAQLKKLQQRRKDVLAKRHDAIKAEMNSARTGIDTGRLIASLVYGVPEYAGIRVPVPKTRTGDEPLKPADLQIVGSVSRIGSNMKYAGYFDERRPIIDPARFMNADRMTRLDKVIRKTIELEKKIQGGT